MRKQRTGYLLITPLLIGYLVFYLVPFARMIRLSFFAGSRFVGIETYRNVLENSSFQTAFGNTFRFLGVGVPLLLALAYVIALLLKSQARQYGLFQSTLLMPYLMPVAGTVLLVELLFSPEGLCNLVAKSLGLAPRDWLSGGCAYGVVLALYLWKNTGYAVVLLLAGLVTIPVSQYESAQLDGAGAWQQFRAITLPQMWDSVFYAALFSVINAFLCFREIFLIGGLHPSQELYMLQHFLNNSFENLNYQKLSAASSLLLGTLLAVFALFYWFVRKKGERL